MNLDEITLLYDFGNLSQFEFVDALEKRSVSLGRKIKSCTTGDSTWNDFQMWKDEKQDIENIFEKII